MELLRCKVVTAPEEFWPRVIKLWFRPILWLADKLIPWDMVNNLKAALESWNPTFIVRPCMMCCGVTSILVTISLIVFWVSLFQYGAIYYMIMPENVVSQSLNFGPAENHERLTSKLFMRENVVSLPSTDL